MQMYVSEIHQCPEVVKASVTEAGNFVVKCEEDVQLSRPRSQSEIAQWHKKERW